MSVLSLWCKTDTNTPLHVRRTVQRHDKKWIFAPFVCGKTGLCRKRWTGGRYSMPSLPFENRISMADYFRIFMMLSSLAVISMPRNRSRWRSQVYVLSVAVAMRAYTAQLSFVRFSAKLLTLWVPFLSTNRSPCRKKSILAKVCFDAKGG